MITFVKIDIEGLDALRMAFDDVPLDALSDVRSAAVAGGELVMERAKGKIKHRTGNLGRSLKITKPTTRGKNKYRIVARVGFTKAGSYGVPLELGHGIIVVHNGKRQGVGVVSERPFLRPAADESRDEVRGIVAAAVNKAIDGMGGKK